MSLFVADFSDEAKCIPVKLHTGINVYGAMTGYDVIQGNPLSSLVDPGVRARIFLHDCKFGYFDFISDVRKDLKCDSDFSMKTIDSMDAYESDRSKSNKFSAGVSAKGEGGIGIVTVKASASYDRSSNSDAQDIAKVLNKYKGEITRAEATCLTHSISISDTVRPVFTPGFIEHLEDLDAATRFEEEDSKKKVISKFIKEFGTHYSKVTKLGAQLIYERRFENTAKTSEEKKIRNGCVKDEATFEVGVESGLNSASVKGHFSNEDCKKSNEKSDFSNTEGFEAVKTISRGSRPTDLSKWIGANFTPIPIKRILDDLSNLFKDEWMTKSIFYGFEKDLDGSKIKAMYDTYIVQYCSLILYGILDEDCNVIGKLQALSY